MGGSLKAQQQSTAERVMFALFLKDFEFNYVCIYCFICLNRVWPPLFVHKMVPM